MNLTQLSSAQIRQLAKLAETKETLLAKVAQIDRQLAVVGGPVPQPAAKTAAKPAPKKRGKKRAKSGQVKNAILGLLKQGGKGGATVKDIADKLGVRVNRIHTWFYGARKTMKQIKKMGPGKYAWIE